MYTPHTPEDVAEMLAAVGVESLERLVAPPAHVAMRAPLDLPEGRSEMEVAARFARRAARNVGARMISFLGAGSYRHYVPPVVGALAMRGEFLTAYTPYQAEVSQGYLQAIYEWQTYIALLTGLDLANASVYDGATALAEGVIMAVNATGKRRVLISRAVHPNYRRVLRTYADAIELIVDEIPYAGDGATDFAFAEAALAAGDVAAFVVQSPNMFGVIDVPPTTTVDAARAGGAVPIGVTAEAMALAALEPPAAWGAEIAVGEGQSFGIAQSYGGPYVGFIACTTAHMRRIPGRLVGKTVDVHGNSAYTLTLQAREQHIRRERATSNICTNQAHCALVATIYLAAMGERGLRDCAAHNLKMSRELERALLAIPGVRRRFSAPYFNEFVIDLPAPAAETLAALAERDILGGLRLSQFYPELGDAVLVTATETTTPEEIATFAAALRAQLHLSPIGAARG